MDRSNLTDVPFLTAVAISKLKCSTFNSSVLQRASTSRSLIEYFISPASENLSPKAYHAAIVNTTSSKPMHRFESTRQSLIVPTHRQDAPVEPLAKTKNRRHILIIQLAPYCSVMTSRAFLVPPRLPTSMSNMNGDKPLTIRLSATPYRILGF